ncbi:glycosyltransferase family 4 protein [Picosynechococcus sp. PCC 11901]|uniref:glycosyltransferase family 4 protein n=1 Tax=Picosynechococcus sp. PCC 11901 TaxID=2579791 RepID=UPI0010FBFABC|nr:glycosyltransferase family 4 protein [Picosynechococcus sp. PCC 11901]QCS50051.1 glycosyltransferase family 4 protein [Picosynechococcus sp. PCC 11901]
MLFVHYLKRLVSSRSQPTINQSSGARNEPQLRLMVLTQFFPPDFAPTGQLIEELTRHLSQQGLDVDIFTGQPGYAFQATDAPRLEQVDSLKVRRSRTAQLWPQRIRGKAINGILFLLRTVLHLVGCGRKTELLLITTAPPFLPIVGYFANLIFRVPYVCLLYDLYPDIAVKLGVIPEQHWLARFWQNMNLRVWRRATGIVVLSPAKKQHITQLCPEIESKVSVIHSWANPDLIVPIPKQKNWFALRYGLIQPFTVLYSGNLGRCHDVETFLEAAILLKDEPIKFVCIGNGAKRQVLMEKREQLGLSNLLLLPYQDKEVLPYSLTACDLSLVSLSPGMERLLAPSKLYSALAAGRPIAVVCPPKSYLKDLVQKTNCGRAIANGDGQGLADFIRQLAGDRPLAEGMGQAGRRYLEENFTPQRIAAQYLEVLQNSVKR